MVVKDSIATHISEPGSTALFQSFTSFIAKLVKYDLEFSAIEFRRASSRPERLLVAWETR